MRKHINLYVNEFSLDLGIAGRNAVMKLLSASALLNPISHKENLEIFID